jgi:hypothetical protein
MWNNIMSLCHKIQYSDINNIKKKCKNLIIYYVKIIELINNFYLNLKLLIEDYILNKNCQNSNENLLENLKDKIENLLIEIENNDIDSNKLFDYRLTKNILSKNYTIDDYFNQNEIHKYKEKYFLEFTFSKYNNYFYSLPIITINFDYKNLRLIIKIFRKFINNNEIKYFELTNYYQLMDNKDYIEIYNYNLKYLESILSNIVYDDLIKYLKNLLNEVEAIYKVIEIIT